MSEQRIGLVGGGNMALALVRGLLASGRVAASAIRASDPSEARRKLMGDTHGVETSADNASVAGWANVVVLAVKPQLIDAAIRSVAGALSPGALVVSIAAGVPLAGLEALLPPGTRVVRAMPNTAAMALAGATGLAAGSLATPADLETARGLFEAVGNAVVVDEPLLDAVTGLSGSGPAYVMLVIEALADGGVKMGLSREVALGLDRAELAACFADEDSMSYARFVETIQPSLQGVVRASLGLASTFQDAYRLLQFAQDFADRSAAAGTLADDGR